MRRVFAEKWAERSNLFKIGFGTDNLQESETSELIVTTASSIIFRQPSILMLTSGHIRMPAGRESGLIKWRKFTRGKLAFLAAFVRRRSRKLRDSGRVIYHGNCEERSITFPRATRGIIKYIPKGREGFDLMKSNYDCYVIYDHLIVTSNTLTVYKNLLRQGKVVSNRYTI